ncbi:hypothetical protein GH714_024551 [Hevea brasiliensis]|uniref:HMA domain-containing protein n=1 Tax=Hevea brasiliensis TaxID=3981 RepID=A0A6A6MGL7_HEVBR|nr:hypothetical protein GH714_024551 [Hevea brasiliensis]
MPAAEEKNTEGKKPAEAKKPEGEKAEKKEEKPAEKPPAEEKKEEKKPEDLKESKEEVPPTPQEIVLKVYMHCEGCARKVRRCLKGFEGVEDVITDCKTSKVVVKGEKADPLKETEKKAEEKGKDKESKEEKKGGGGDKENKGGEQEENKEKKESVGQAKPEAAAEPTVTDETKVVELKKNEYNYYTPRYAMELYAYPPQIFSDENPNACSVM